MAGLSHNSGYLIAIDSLNPLGAESCRYAAHLISNISAAMAIGDIPQAPTFTARVGAEYANHDSIDEKYANPDTEGDYEMVTYSPQSHDEARNRLRVAMNAGAIAIMDQVMVSADKFLHEQGRVLDIGHLVAHASQAPDVVIYMDMPDDQVPVEQRALHEQYHQLAEAFPHLVVVIPFSPDHEPMCDEVWRQVSRRLKAWAEYRDAPDGQQR